MVKPYLLGVDLGTMGTKAALYDVEGKLLGDAYEESILRYPRVGWVEQDLEEIHASAVNCIKLALRRAGVDPKDIAALAFSSQMSGIGMIDRNWWPVAHYDSWLDTRCASCLPLLEPEAEAITTLSGCPPTYAHAAKVVWWQRNQPEAFARTAKFIVPLAYVAGKLAGLEAEDAYIDLTCLHFSGLSDTLRGRWSGELLDRFGIPAVKLPRIVRPTEVIGKITLEAARLTGLPAGTPVAAGAGDQAAASLGAGAVNPADVFDSAGTASVFSICVDQFRADTRNRVVLASHGVLPGTFYALSFINGGGLNLRWFREQFGQADLVAAPGADAYQVLDRLAAALPPGSGGTLFLPHLQGRVLPPDAKLRGLWTGFTWGHSRAHLYRAMLESVAYEYAYYLRIEQELHPELRCREVRAIGGGAASGLWNQIKSDVLDIPYARVNRAEVGTWGSAMIAGAAVGIFPDLRATARSHAALGDLVAPRPDQHRLYRPYVDLYRKILEDYSRHFGALADLADQATGSG